ncbi:aminomethyl-transferring glycine dehydrogenase [Tenacibaculum finnmarkense genomovar finnmarkense]|uniref:glycine dehydrogenase (aminomethyl-transferring) n=1 Tax=Tenacibaculum finnmarkense genomovar finnmarkense TaxID=1458503 RepID=A0AAP1RFZ2_9FLAO|nr:aminomethyl-transferring glycine dehydrogenase [Tenacibaculum finnmarkense]MBE7653314.1 aminomethyl-transferring glycine dehydrogenase [Tenacibaculum finnmarkense genomovar finnmarkense]MBE7661387.1 aminomethyl-transferring glycine dehydrogenase [Tenacibaculum finnmarkense genomovar finnmarkense]MBE7695615.1 aminomethyl-transferring glycine dehydrogenase [Tenacibaculum finnmarkense genomovar finnmarkense]MCD8412457.1 aminomethyl-transferring glycine dehydrogenase [Tenacibaculum finnmarkense 
MNTNSFQLRHIGPNSKGQEKMLETIKSDSIDQLIFETIPDDIRLKNELDLAPAMSEYEYLNHITELGAKNKVFKSYIGLGYHQAIVPSVIQRNILENPSWYTAYTPYQAEIAQGRLEALLNFQTMVCDLTGMELANASLLDESTAAAEAMALLFDVRERAQKKAGVTKFFVSEDILPQTLSVLQTRSTPIGIELVVGNHEEFDFSEDFFGAIVQYPGKHGQVCDYTEFVANCNEKNIKVAVAADILSLVKLKAPAEFGAAVVVGTTQRFGIPLGYGGPHAGYFATKEAYKRSLPGRVIGVTKDVNGGRALRMALQTREQHIKREKATSNICTAQVLLAVMAGMYAVYHGKDGLQYIADRTHAAANTLATALETLGFKQKNSAYFDTILIEVEAEKLRTVAQANGINFNYIDNNHVSISVNETVSLKEINAIVDCFEQAFNVQNITVTQLTTTVAIAPNVLRNTSFLDNDVFNTYQSETEMMRYIKKLERKDLALNHSMISLGSCTMKLNAASEMLPLSNAQWGNIHPFVPLEQAEGYQTVLKNLEEQLNVITGFAGTSLQPNSGAQGEFAGLMVIRAYHESNDDAHRNICLIPASAHGTNPASAVMAGMKVVVTKTDEKGNIDVEDLRAKAEKHKDNLAALMVTYPSTHGVYEKAIKEITQIIHDNGGQVYMDGANMNAQVGLTNPATIGADVCHLNLHKTFAIPHGGGGPGVGPICVAPQLVPFLPSNPLIPTGGENAITAISSAPWGSALVCLISYGYITMLGAKGLTDSTKNAILNANYIKERLHGHYETLYSGEMNRAAHEMIIDCRDFKQNGIEVVDIAKRLMDYGFHAPTVSFPVGGTMMIEPTESENVAELDRFCDAMIAIRKEISEVTKEDANNPLKNAPHTQAMLTDDQWDLPYTRQQAAFPLSYVADNKFWPSVRRVDDAFGDRNLICSCNPIEDYIDEEA